ncbi:MAG: hypothetical protein SOZ27_00800 [Spirochaetia bacterium]|nr:hypothetical protein [Spirochaetia bacterium]
MKTIRYKSERSRKLFQILILSLLIVIAGMGALIAFDYLGLIHLNFLKRDYIDPQFTQRVDLTGIDLLDSERLYKIWGSMDEWESELKAEAENLALKDKEVEEKMALLTAETDAFRKEQESQAAKQRDTESRERKFYDITVNLLGMPPETAVKSLEKMADYDVIEILKSADKIAEERNQGSMSSYWLSLMEPEKVAAINRKRLQAPAGE